MFRSQFKYVLLENTKGADMQVSDIMVFHQSLVGVCFAYGDKHWNLWWSYNHSEGSGMASPQCECVSEGLSCPAVKISLGRRRTCMA